VALFVDDEVEVRCDHVGFVRSFGLAILRMSGGAVVCASEVSAIVFVLVC